MQEWNTEIQEWNNEIQEWNTEMQSHRAVFAILGFGHVTEMLFQLKTPGFSNSSWTILNQSALKSSFYHP